MFPDDHPDVSAILNNLGLLLNTQEKYSEAEIYYRNTLTLLKRFFSEDHPNVATSLNNLGVFSEAQGKYIEAESYYRDALGMRERLFPKGHPEIANILNDLGLLLGTKGKQTEALEKLLEAVTVENNLTSLIFAFSSEADRIRHLDSIKLTTNNLLSLVVTHFSYNLQAIQNALDVMPLMLSYNAKHLLLLLLLLSILLSMKNATNI